MVLGLVLLGLASALAWPVPLLLARDTALTRPVFALVLWQLVGLTGGLSLIGASACLGLYPALSRGDFSLAHLAWFNWLFCALAAALTGLLCTSLVREWAQQRRLRRRHCDAVLLLSRPSDSLPATRILDSDEPVAFCLPADGTAVITTGLLASLSPDERAAVIAHELAHLSMRHDLFVLPFAAWRRALPCVPATSTALAAVTTLVEFMSDDLAAAEVSPDALARALSAVDALSAPGPARELTRLRLRRLERRAQ